MHDSLIKYINRYASTPLANTYPEFLQRFPQHIIASYLGITSIWKRENNFP